MATSEPTWRYVLALKNEGKGANRVLVAKEYVEHRGNLQHFAVLRGRIEETRLMHDRAYDIDIARAIARNSIKRDILARIAVAP